MRDYIDLHMINLYQITRHIGFTSHVLIFIGNTFCPDSPINIY